MTEADPDAASVQQGAPSDAGSIADSDDSDFEVGASSASASDSSSSEEDQQSRSRHVQRLHLQGEDGGLSLPEHEEELDDADLESSDEDIRSDADGPTHTQHSTAPTEGDAVDSQPTQPVPAAPAVSAAGEQAQERQQPQSQQRQQPQSFGVDGVGGEEVARGGSDAAEDAVARRTRAQQSLLEYDLEDLEALLQGGAEDAQAQEDAEYEAFIQSVLAPSPELGVLPEDDDEDNDFVVDLDEILAAATQEEAAQQEQVRQTRLRSQHDQMAAQQQPEGPVTNMQLAKLHQQISQHTQLLMQSYARTSVSPQHLHAAAVARALLFALAQRRQEQLITRQARGLPPFICGGGSMQSVMDVALLHCVPGFLADMDSVLLQPRPPPVPQMPRAHGLPPPPPPPPPAVAGVLDRFSSLLDPQLRATTLGVSTMRDGAAWSSCDDVLLGMGLLKWGQNHGAIAADLLPGYTPSQVAQRVLERTHRNRAANPVKDAAERIRGPLLPHEVVLICRGVRECPLTADGDIQWPVISRMLLPHRSATLLAKLWSDLCEARGGMPELPGIAITADFVAAAAQMRQEAEASAALAAAAGAAAAASKPARRRQPRRPAPRQSDQPVVAAAQHPVGSTVPRVESGLPAGAGVASGAQPVQLQPGRGHGRGRTRRGVTAAPAPQPAAAVVAAMPLPQQCEQAPLPLRQQHSPVRPPAPGVSDAAVVPPSSTPTQRLVKSPGPALLPHPGVPESSIAERSAPAASSGRHQCPSAAVAMHRPCSPQAAAPPSPTQPADSESMSEGDQEYRPPAAAAAARAQPEASAAVPAPPLDPAAQAATQAALQRAAGASSRPQRAWMQSPSGQLASAPQQQQRQHPASALREIAQLGGVPDAGAPASASASSRLPLRGQGLRQPLLDTVPPPRPANGVACARPGAPGVASNASRNIADQQRTLALDAAAQDLLRIRGTSGLGTPPAEQASRKKQAAAHKPRQAVKRPRRNPVPARALPAFEQEALPASASSGDAASPGRHASGGPRAAASAPQQPLHGRQELRNAPGAWPAPAGELPRFDLEELPMSSSGDDQPGAPWQGAHRPGQVARDLGGDAAAAALILNELSNDRSMPLDTSPRAANPAHQQRSQDGGGSKVVFHREALADSDDSAGTLTNSGTAAAPLAATTQTVSTVPESSLQHSTAPASRQEQQSDIDRAAATAQRSPSAGRAFAQRKGTTAKETLVKRSSAAVNTASPSSDAQQANGLIPETGAGTTAPLRQKPATAAAWSSSPSASTARLPCIAQLQHEAPGKTAEAHAAPVARLPASAAPEPPAAVAAGSRKPQHQQDAAATSGAVSAAPQLQPARAWALSEDRLVLRDLMVAFKGKGPPLHALQETAARLSADGAACSTDCVQQRLEFLTAEFRKRRQGK